MANRRAGLFFDVSSSGSLAASLADDNTYGLVAAPEGGVEVATDNAIIGNEDDDLFGGQLEVPDVPMAPPCRGSWRLRRPGALRPPASAGLAREDRLLRTHVLQE